MHPEEGLVARVDVGRMVAVCSVCWYVCLVGRIMTVSLIAKCFGESLHTCCIGVCVRIAVCVCLCYLYVQAVVPDLFTGTSFNFLLGPCLFCISLGLCVCFCVCLRQRKGFAPGDLSKEFALSRHIQLFHFLCVSEKG